MTSDTKDSTIMITLSGMQTSSYWETMIYIRLLISVQKSIDSHHLKKKMVAVQAASMVRVEEYFYSQQAQRGTVTIETTNLKLPHSLLLLQKLPIKIQINYLITDQSLITQCMTSLCQTHLLNKRKFSEVKIMSLIHDLMDSRL